MAADALLRRSGSPLNGLRFGATHAAFRSADTECNFFQQHAQNPYVSTSFPARPNNGIDRHITW
jgi:hypothetical protein